MEIHQEESIVAFRFLLEEEIFSLRISGKIKHKKID